MHVRATKTLVAAVFFFCLYGSGRMVAQNLRIVSECPQNSCSLDIGAKIPAGRIVHVPGPATASTDFAPVGQPWSFSLQTGPPVSWGYSQQGYWYQADFGEGGTFQMTGPSGTFTGTITSAAVDGGEMPFFIYDLSASFVGNWSNGMQDSGTVQLSYEDDLGVVFSSTLTVALGHAGGSLPNQKLIPR